MHLVDAQLALVDRSLVYRVRLRPVDQLAATPHDRRQALYVCYMYRVTHKKGV